MAHASRLNRRFVMAVVSMCHGRGKHVSAAVMNMCRGRGERVVIHSTHCVLYDFYMHYIHDFNLF